jgi:hypothetical protein
VLPSGAPAQNRQLGAGQSSNVPATRDEETVHAEIEDDHEEK